MRYQHGAIARIISTMKYNKLISSTLLLTSLLASISAFAAFDRDGLSSGTPLDELTDSLKSKGYSVSKALVLPNKRVSLVQIARPSANHAASLYFCDDRLWGYWRSEAVLEPKFNSFLERLNELTKQHGPATYRTIGAGSKPDPRPSMLRFQWKHGEEVIYLDYSTFGFGPVSTNQFAVGYFDSQMDCPL